MADHEDQEEFKKMAKSLAMLIDCAVGETEMRRLLAEMGEECRRGDPDGSTRDIVFLKLLEFSSAVRDTVTALEEIATQ